jgi:hypothetical protein
MHEILIIADLSGLPLKGDIFELIDSKAIGGDSFDDDIIYFIAIDLIFECKVITLVICDDL